MRTGSDTRSGEHSHRPGIRSKVEL